MVANSSAEMSEQNVQAGEVNEAEEVLDVVLPSGDEAAEAVHPREEPFLLPAPLWKFWANRSLRVHVTSHTCGTRALCPHGVRESEYITASSCRRTSERPGFSSRCSAG